MLRHLSAVAASLLLSACVIQPPPGYWGRTAYPRGYYPSPYARNWNAQPAQYPQTTPASWSQPAPVLGPTETAQPEPASFSPHEARNPHATFADETVDYGVPPTTTLHLHDFDAPTPTHIQGARTVTTLEVQSMLTSDNPPVLVDVIGGEQTVSLPNATWLRDAGVGRHIDDDIQAWLDYHLARLTNRDKTHPLVFFCASRMCWMAHNATLRAIDLGYTNVSWYRGGRDAWQAAGLPMAPVGQPHVDD
jgi:PQQ-dependent catabolism-associated CXXCW motif protein